MPLKDVTVRNARATSKPRKLSDCGGLYILVQPSGSKLWRLAYRFAGKQKTLAIGVYPIVSLEEARRQRDEAKKLLARSIDPSVQRRADRLAGKEGTFRAVAEEVLAKHEREGRAHATLSKKRWLLAYAFPAFGDRPVVEITARELLTLLRELEGRGLYETARRLRSTCGMVFRYAIATGRGERDPSLDLRGALTTPQVESWNRLGSVHCCAPSTATMDNRRHVLRYSSRRTFLCGPASCGKRNGRNSTWMAQCGASQQRR
jgi:hypothetical protein